MSKVSLEEKVGDGSQSHGGARVTASSLLDGVCCEKTSGGDRGVIEGVEHCLLPLFERFMAWMLCF